MDITVYLPDAIGEQAKKAELPLSRMLRGAVERELGRRQAVLHATEEMTTHEITIDADEFGASRDGVEVLGRFTGKLLATDGDDSIYLTDDGRFIVHSAPQHWIVDDSDELMALINKPQLNVEVAQALGIRAVIDL